LKQKGYSIVDVYVVLGKGVALSVKKREQLFFVRRFSKSKSVSSSKT
jgi:hypothetical protein